MRTHSSSGMRNASREERASFFNSSNVTGGRTSPHTSCKLCEPSRNESIRGFASTGSPSLICCAALPETAGGWEPRTLCQKGAYVSISMYADPTRLLSTVLKSNPSVCVPCCTSTLTWHTWKLLSAACVVGHSNELSLRSRV